MDWTLEVVLLPVSDIDAAIAIDSTIAERLARRGVVR